MTKDWGDGKRFLFEHICDGILYCAIFLGATFLDPILNLLRALGLNSNPAEPEGHPYQIGAYQAVALVFSTIQILRLLQKLNEWRYYK